METGRTGVRSASLSEGRKAVSQLSACPLHSRGQPSCGLGSKAWIWLLDTLVQVPAQSLIQLCDVSQNSCSFCPSSTSACMGLCSCLPTFIVPAACPPSCRLVWSTWEAYLNQPSPGKYQSSLQPRCSQQNPPFPLILGKMCIELHLSP